MSIVVKICNCDGKGTVRRRQFNASNVTLAQVQELANLQNNKKLTWRDEDDDVIAVETESDLQDAISYAVTQKSSLRLMVDNTGTSAGTEPTTESAPVQATSTRTKMKLCSFDLSDKLRSAGQRGYETLVSAAKIAQSTLASSKVVQAIQEDACSIRGFLESRVERNRTPIQLAMGVVSRGVLLWGIFFGLSFWMLLTILIGALLTPRNALRDRAHAQVRILFGFLALRIAMGFLHRLIFCFIPILLICFVGVLFVHPIRLCFQHMVRRRAKRRRKTKRRPSHPHQHFSSTFQQQHKDIEALRRIFPAMDIRELQQAYARYNDVETTVLELAK